MSPKPPLPQETAVRHLAAITAIAIAAFACAPAPHPTTAPHYAATIQPLAAIVTELAAGRAGVVRLLPPGQSPHTYDPRPSDAKAAETAFALVYVDPNLDGWAASLPASQHIVAFDAVPEKLRLAADETVHGSHDHGEHDPHFWLDPQAVDAALNTWITDLETADPQGGAAYEENAAAFRDQLRQLDAELNAILEAARGKSVFLVHPSFRYMLHRYGINVAGYIEPLPGKEPRPRYVAELIERAKRDNVAAIFTEPQLSQSAAETIAREAGTPIAELDPIGGVPGRETYVDLLRHNARVIAETLQ